MTADTAHKGGTAMNRMPRAIIDRLIPISCGILLARGITSAGITSQWNMSALTDPTVGSFCAAVMFGAGCALVVTLRKDFGYRANTAMTLLISALYVIAELSEHSQAPRLAVCIADIVFTLIALCAVEQSFAPAVSAFLPALTLPAIFLGQVFPSPLPSLRLNAVLCCLSSAGLCGAAISRLSHIDSASCLLLLVLGLTAGML